MPTIADAAVRDCVRAVDATFEDVFGSITGWRTEIETFLSDRAGATSTADLDPVVEDLTVPTLSAPGALVIGAGFVAAPGFLVDAEFHLAWWLGHANTFGLGSAEPAVRRLAAVEDPGADDFRDYTALEWWRGPRDSGVAHITGPYVDYLCTDDYTLTVTVPTRRRGEMVGVVGADLFVRDVERLLLPHVQAIGGAATLINASGRVVVGADRRHPTGSVLRGDLVAVPCGATSLALVLD